MLAAAHFVGGCNASKAIPVSIQRGLHNSKIAALA
jgi:hypothetical protein